MHVMGAGALKGGQGHKARTGTAELTRLAGRAVPCRAKSVQCTQVSAGAQRHTHLHDGFEHEPLLSAVSIASFLDVLGLYPINFVDCDLDPV